MIHLDVKLDSRLYEALHSAAQGARGDVGCLRQYLEKMVLREEVFGSDQELISKNLDPWFEVGPMVSGRDFWPQQNAMRAYIEQRLDQSIAALLPFVPVLPMNFTKALTVYLIPGLVKCYGPREGIQLFALRAGAQPAEGLLFLIHVYYHEISSLFYTETSRRAANNPDSPELFKHWLLLLIQNEGLANYVVLEPLLDLQERGCAFSYFTYSDLMHNEVATAQAMNLCREIISQLNEDNFYGLRAHVSEILKNPGLPVINLVGIHLAEAIAKRFGEHALLAVADREPQEFFRMYGETGDPLCQYLFGPRGETAPMFGLPGRPKVLLSER